MKFSERLQAVRERMQSEGLDVLVGFHDATHFGGSPDPLRVLTGFHCLDASAIVVHATKECSLVVTPGWDAERAAAYVPGMKVLGADDLVRGVTQCLEAY